MCLTLSSRAVLSFILKSMGISLVLTVLGLLEGGESGDWSQRNGE